MPMFNLRVDYGAGSDGPQSSGGFSSHVHRHQPQRPSGHHQHQQHHQHQHQHLHAQHHRHRHAGERKQSACESVTSRCQHSCVSKAWKKLAMLGILTLHLGLMLAVLAHKGVPLLPDPHDAGAVLQILGILMALGGAACVVTSFFVFRRQKRRLHPCMCMESGAECEDDSDFYIPPEEEHSHPSLPSSTPNPLRQSHAHYDVARARLPTSDENVVLTSSVHRRDDDLRYYSSTPKVSPADHAPSSASKVSRTDHAPSSHAPSSAPKVNRRDHALSSHAPNSSTKVNRRDHAPRNLAPNSSTKVSRTDRAHSSHAHTNPVFEGTPKQHRARSEPFIHARRIHYKMHTRQGRPSLPVLREHVGTKRPSMISLV